MMKANDDYTKNRFHSRFPFRERRRRLLLRKGLLWWSERG